MSRTPSTWNDSYSWGSGPTRAGITPGMVEFDPQGSYGTAIGYDPDSSAAPGGTYTYKFYVDQELGPTLFLNLADEDSTLHGGYGALIAEPSGSTYTDPATGSTLNSGLVADIHNSTVGSFREFATFVFDNDPIIGHSIMPYNRDVQSEFDVSLWKVMVRQSPALARRTSGITGLVPFLMAGSSLVSA